MTQIKRKLEEFERLDKIGQGSYGVVYKVRKKFDDRDIVALKRVKLNFNLNGLDEGIPSSSLREIAALKSLKHPNVLELFDIIHTGSCIYLVFEYLDQDLKKTLDATQNGLSDKLAKSYLLQLLKGIAFCHSRRIIHRDLKLQNLLVNIKDDIVKLADFGLARNMSLPLRCYTKEVVTLWYRAPEILLGSDIYGPAVDVWSLGCIFFEMKTKKALFEGDSEIDQLFKIFQILGTPNQSQWENVSNLPHYKTQFPVWSSRDLRKLLTKTTTSAQSSNLSSSTTAKTITTTCDNSICEEVADLLGKMLCYDPFKRISAQDAMKHAYFDTLAKRPTLRNIQDPSIVRHSKSN